MSDQRTNSRVYHSDEYDADESAPVSLTRALERDFKAVEIGRTPWPSKEDLAAVTEAARVEGYEAGRQQALAEAERERERHARALRHLLDGLIRPYDDLNEEIAQELARLAVDVGAALFLRELKQQPAQLAAIVRSAVAALPNGARQATIHLHPDDVALCRHLLKDDEVSYQFEADPGIDRGGCLVSAEDARVDATLKQRMALLAEAMCDESPENHAADAV